MSKHTPGPWVIRTAATYRSQVEAIDPKGRADVVARITAPRKGAEASDANAHLIAAAPDMLEALEAVEAWWNAHGIEGDHRTDAFCTLARTAIKKARGQS